MKILSQIFGHAKAEILPQVSQDSQCPTCKSYLLHSEQRLEYGGTVYCKKSCIPPSVIARVEEDAKLAAINAQRAANERAANLAQTRIQALEWAYAELRSADCRAYLYKLGIDFRPRLRAIHKELHPNDPRYLHLGDTMSAQNVNGVVVLQQPERHQ